MNNTSLTSPEQVTVAIVDEPPKLAVVTPAKISKNSRRSRNSILISPKKIPKVTPTKELPEVKCDVCQVVGKPQELVK